MRKPLIIGGLAATALLVAAGPSQAQKAKAVQWKPSFKAAMEAAKSSDKLVMVDFYTEW